MSLVLSTIEKGMPALFGDILISRTDKVTANIPIPTIPDEASSKLPMSKGSVVAHCQKIVCIKSDVVAGWAGSLSGAKILYNILKKELNDYGTTIEHLQAVLGTTVLELQYHTQLILWIGLSSPECFFWDSRNYDKVEKVKTPYAIGSGSRHILEVCKSEVRRTAKNTIDSSLITASSLISLELAYGTNIVDLWGGAVQILVSDGSKYYFYTDYMLIFYLIIEKSNRDLEGILHPYVFQPAIYDDFYLIQRFNHVKKEVDCFGISSLAKFGKNPKIVEYKPNYSKPEYYCIACVFQHKQGFASQFTIVLPREDPPNLIDSIITEKEFRIGFKGELLKEIMNQARRVQDYAREHS